MKRSNRLRGGLRRGFRILTTAGFLATLLLSACVAAQPTVQPTPEPSQLREWRESVAVVPVPKKGCFEASYPSKEWREVTCVTAPDIPQPPGEGPWPLVIGNRNDVSAQVASGFIGTGIGSFDSVISVTSVSSPIGNAGAAVMNAYTLQLNTNPFASTACAGSPNMNCQGWQQFVYANDGSAGTAFIQYWLIRYNATCPAGQGWRQFQFTGGTDIYCWKNNSAGAVAVPNQLITNLANLSLTGTVSAGGDNITMATGATVYSVAGDNSVNAAAGWSMAEFNVFGYGGNSNGGGQATFNNGASITPRVRVLNGGTAAPTCAAQGFTGETNNLSFGSPAPAVSGLGPALFFIENSAGGALSACAAGTTIGDTHMTTFAGLLYDFQASGDFILAQADPDFVVQARQVSGAPSWPNASVNKAVAARLGKDMVALCPGPERSNLYVNEQAVTLDDGKPLILSGDGEVVRKGNIYFIVDPAGNSVRAILNASWIDVSVGLGAWPTQVKGLLADAQGKVGNLEASDGTVLTTPFAFDELYQRYGDSWRVASDQSLLTVCGKATEEGNPDKPFGVGDLDQDTAGHARAVCMEAGIKEGPLLDACILDVAVIGDDEAAKAYVNMPPPVMVGTIKR